MWSRMQGCRCRPASPKSRRNGIGITKTPWRRDWMSSTPSTRRARPWPSPGTKWSGTAKPSTNRRSDPKGPTEGDQCSTCGPQGAWAWAKVVKSFTHYETVEAAWKQAATALNVFRPDGRLNDRAWAEAQVGRPCRISWAGLGKGLQPSSGSRDIHVSGPHAQRVGPDPGPRGTARRWCDSGGFDGSGRGNPSRGRSRGRAMWRTWSNRRSARSWIRPGGSGIDKSQPSCVRRCVPAAW